MSRPAEGLMVRLAGLTSTPRTRADDHAHAIHATAYRDKPMLSRHWPGLIVGFPASLLLLAALPWLQLDATVTWTLVLSSTALLAWAAALIVRERKRTDGLSISYVAVPSHYVQAVVQICIYAYWGWYWRPVYDHAGLIVAQLLFAYTLDLLLSLTRRRRWVLGFGPFPIILSTNLFLLFRPEWFYLQFALVATGILGKEFIRWKRDGRNTHIFNPSAFSLFIFSVALILSGKSSWSFAEEIATTLNRPPDIYLQIFLLGLVVQGLFSVTLVTLTSALALIALNLAYTGSTGVYYFIDSNIPIAVFLGLHLLITDPATSPRTAVGKAIFGILYGSFVFMLYGLLGAAGAPTYYDKLLCVPILNLMVPWIDAATRRLGSGAIEHVDNYSDVSRKANFATMAIWIVVFTVMLNTSFVGAGHKGNEDAFWKSACDDDLRNGCSVLLKRYREYCSNGNATACAEGAALIGRKAELNDRVVQGQLLARGCDLGNSEACVLFREYAREDKAQSLISACADDDAVSCYITGLIFMNGAGMPRDPARAVQYWQRACNGGWARGCSDLGEAYLFGRGTGEDPGAAASAFTLACNGGYQPGCTTLGLMYRRGHGVPQDETRASTLIRTACDSGWELACENLDVAEGS